MPDDVIEVENELRNIIQEQGQLAEQIHALQKDIHDDETWLRSDPPATVGYQEVLKERLAPYRFIGDAVILSDLAEGVALLDAAQDIRPFSRGNTITEDNYNANRS
jgi:hypothetical protein